ncbi:MAG: PAS domain S-box protein [Proteobacteria bacterium]|nr:PAS domain S-box protein [Pseudomonadota bacterium]
MTMPPSNSGFFLDKPPEGQKSLLMRRNSKALILFFLSAAYGLFIYFILDIGLRGHQNVSMFVLYVYGLVGGFGFLLLNQFYTGVDRSRKILIEVLEKSAEARVITDPDGNTIYANPRFSKLVSGAENPPLFSFARMFEDPRSVEKDLEELRRRALPAGAAMTEFQTNVRGRSLWFQVTCQHIIGWPGFIHWRFEDITHRHQMEAAIRAEREKLRDFMDNAPVGFFSVDEGGKFLFANEMLLRLLGTDFQTLVGKGTLHDFLVSPPQNARPYDFFDTGGLHQRGELLMRGSGERVFKAAVTHSIAESEEGVIISRSVVYDLTAHAG